MATFAAVEHNATFAVEHHAPQAVGSFTRAHSDVGAAGTYSTGTSGVDGRSNQPRVVYQHEASMLSSAACSCPSELPLKTPAVVETTSSGCGGVGGNAGTAGGHPWGTYRFEEPQPAWHLHAMCRTLLLRAVPTRLVHLENNNNETMKWVWRKSTPCGAPVPPHRHNHGNYLGCR